MKKCLSKQETRLEIILKKDTIVALNMFKGRTTNQVSRDEAYQLAKDFTEKFTEKYGVTCCRALNPYPFETREHLTNCLKITGNTSKMLMEFIKEKELI